MGEGQEMNSEIMEPQAGFAAWLPGVRQALPIVMGYLPVGAAFGVLAHKTGLSAAETALMSLLVYAGSAQLIAVAMFAAGMPPVSIVVTTFVVNLRHLLMTASLAPGLKGWSRCQLGLFAYQVTDETFAVHSSRFARGETGRAVGFAINVTAHAAWVLASWLGHLAGAAIPDVRPLGLDYALPAMFIALLTMQVRNGLHVLVAGFSGLAAMVLIQAGADRFSVIVATIAGATFGAGVESWMKRQSS
ncbi:branched-chain amino acid ABC transporter permease [Pseudodesulfovibrio sp. F-1]|uniref:Branched-chain amino acid ABC transporter permease n=2 Tax=Pseudodesulfovibrio alkaliphilus TaxID=2661613 RepID=A0A7K1KK27_9BACT|nr:branched-chain amino acid ABC transporter permease [Pseudodesulfovibrio alkaliphilus]